MRPLYGDADDIQQRAERAETLARHASAMEDRQRMANDCLCHVRGDLEIVYCPLHEAAPELLKELKGIADGFERCIIHAGSDPEMAKIRTAAARKAIKKAEGKANG